MWSIIGIKERGCVGFMMNTGPSAIDDCGITLFTKYGTAEKASVLTGNGSKEYPNSMYMTAQKFWDYVKDYVIYCFSGNTKVPKRAELIYLFNVDTNEWECYFKGKKYVLDNLLHNKNLLAELNPPHIEPDRGKFIEKCFATEKDPDAVKKEESPETHQNYKSRDNYDRDDRRDDRRDNYYDNKRNYDRGGNGGYNRNYDRGDNYDRGGNYGSHNGYRGNGGYNNRNNGYNNGYNNGGQYNGQAPDPNSEATYKQKSYCHAIYSTLELDDAELLAKINSFTKGEASKFIDEHRAEYNQKIAQKKYGGDGGGSQG